jgi:hypothetical protein
MPVSNVQLEHKHLTLTSPRDLVLKLILTLPFNKFFNTVFQISPSFAKWLFALESMYISTSDSLSLCQAKWTIRF